MLAAGGIADVRIEARALTKSYGAGERRLEVLRGVDLAVGAGPFVSVMGPSGSGKSTLLHLLGGLDSPDGGEVLLDGRPLSTRSDEERTRLRRTEIGVVYQFFNLVPVLTTAENIALPGVIAGVRPREAARRVDELLALVDLQSVRDARPSQLSGGQQQRAAIARALFASPAVLLADEPTGNLDLHAGTGVLDLFVRAQRDLGQTIVMVTHDPRAAAYGDEAILLRDGEVASCLAINAKVRGEARTDRSSPLRSRAVLRWLEASAPAPVDEGPVSAPTAVRGRRTAARS
jgi:putative ABC transport system ATP-binding protein